MLLENFYTLESNSLLDDNVVKSTMILNNDHQVFDGHFPNNPVTPGVCMMQIIKEIVEHTLQLELQLFKVSNVKFTALINPNVNKELQLETVIIKELNSIRIKNISKFTNGTIALKYNATFNIK
ncbi:hotdog family protein [Tenacibaculum halocynthiae]|uniref:3-hydroxyacyl-ACP dehydratase n=1 Tax=Tenacibaculum halocynthiae TaxID=1254437 RepID=UPI003894AB61